MTKQEQIELLQKIRDNICGIFDGIADEFDEDSDIYQCIADVEQDLDTLAISLAEREVDENVNYYEHCFYDYDNEIEETVHKSYTKAEAEIMMRRICKVLAFSDCTDEHVGKIVYRGREVEYIGWQPGMVYEFADGDGVVRYSAAFPEWDH